MKKTFLLLILFAATTFSFAQDTSTTTTRPQKVNIDLSARGSDHLLIQVGGDKWLGKPDSIRTKGFSRHFNIYFMLDKPFGTNPKFSVAYGLGIGSSNMFFDKMQVDLKATGTTTLPFRNLDTSSHFKKYKLTTIYAELPVELRWYSDPSTPSKSWKVAVGAKVGQMLKAFTKGKNFQTRGGQSIYGQKYIVKESEKRYFNGTKLAVHGRVGYGMFSLHGQYQITQLLKEGAGPEIRPFSVGLTIAGL
jgi:hypothetical protein